MTTQPFLMVDILACSVGVEDAIPNYATVFR